VKLDPDNAFAEPEAPPPDTTAHTRPPGHRTRGIAVAAGAGLLLVIVWLVTTRLPDWLTRTSGGGSSSASEGGAAGEGRRIQATLFYVSEDGTGLIETSRTVAFGATPVEQARRLVEAQVAAPPNGLSSAIPAGTTVRAVYLTEAHEAYVDLGGAIVSGHTGGSLNEALSVYAIVNAVIANLPNITAVQILVEGKEIDSLAGHVDLRAPLGKAEDWIRKGSPPS
jgi:hypothetical protein